MANAITYIKNVGKSIGYASVSVFKEKNPVFADFAETNGELMVDMYKSVKDLKKNIKRLPEKIMESEYGQFGKTYLENLMDDLKTGKFYNKEREDEYMSSAADSFSDGLDMDVFDDFGDGDSDLDISSLDDDTISSNEMMDIVGEKSSTAVSTAVARSAEYIVQANAQSSKAMTRNMNAIYGGIHTGMSTINQNISKILEFSNENMNLHFENSKTFYGEMTRMNQEQTQYLKEISETLKVMNEPPKTSDNKRTNYSDLISSEGNLDLANYGKHIKKNIMDNTGLGMIVDAIKMAESAGGLKTFAASPLQFVVDGIVNSVIPKTLEKSMENLNKSLSGMMGNLLMTIKQKSEDIDAGGGIWTWLNDILGIDTERRTSINPGQYEKGKVPFDGITRKAIIEVIPTYLSKILSALTGNKRDTFDYDKGQFTTLESLQKKIDDMTVSGAKSAASDMDQVFRQKVESYNLNSEELKAFKEFWEKAKLELYKDQKRLETRDQNFVFDVDPTEDKHYTKMLKEMFDNTPENLAYANRMYSQLASQSRRMESLQGSSSINSLFNEDSSTDKGIPVISGLFSNANQAIVDKLEEIHKELAFIRVFGVGGSGGGSNNSSKSYIPKVNFHEWEIPKPRQKESETEQQKKKEPSTTEEAAPSITIPKDRSLMTLENIEAVQKQWEEYDKYTKRPEDFVGKKIPQKPEISKTELGNLKRTLQRKQDKDSNKKKTLSDKIADLKKGALGIVQGPMNLAASMMDKVDARLYELVYGPITGKIEDDDRTLKEILFDKIEDNMNKITDFIQEKIIDPLTTKSLKENAHDAAKKFLSIFGIDLDKSIEGIKKFVFGEDEDGNRTKGGFLGKFINDFKDTFKSAGEWIKGGFKSLGDETGVTSKKNEKGLAKEKINKSLNNLGEVGQEVKNEDGTTSVKTATDVANDFINSFNKNEADINNIATGARRVNKTGLAVISKGEMIIPPDMNPLNIAKRYQDENIVKQNFVNSIHNYAEGEDNALSDDERLTTAANTIVSKIKEMEINGEDIVPYLSELRSHYSDEDFVKLLSHAKKESLEKGDYEKGKEPFWQKIGDELLNGATKGSQFIQETVKENFSVNEKDSEKFKENASNVLKDILGNTGTLAAGATIGAGVSLLTGLIGGPLFGAAAGAAVALTTKSKTFQKMLFGDEETGDTGLLPKNLTNAIKKYLPDMGLGGAMGGIISMIPGIPGGPLAGIMVGSALGFAKNNERIQNAIFGEEGIGMTKEEFKKEIQRKLPKMGAGALVGALAGPFGPATNIILGSAIGFASDTEAFKNVFFGEYDPETEKRDGGIFGEIVKPVTKFLKDTFEEFKEFFFKDMLKPVVDAFQPIKKQIEIMGTSIANMFKDHIIVPIEKTIRDNIIKPIGTMFSWLFKPLKGLAKFLLSGPSKIIGNIGHLARGHQIKTGQADYMKSANQRVLYRQKRGMWMKVGDPRTDKYYTSDESLSNMNTEQLNVAEDALSAIVNSNKTVDEIKSSAYRNISKALKPGEIDANLARDIKDLIENNQFDKAVKTIKLNKKLDKETKKQLLDTIAKEEARLKKSLDLRGARKEDKEQLLRQLSDAGFKIDDRLIKEISSGKKGAKSAERLLKQVMQEAEYKSPQEMSQIVKDAEKERLKPITSRLDLIIKALNRDSNIDHNDYKKDLDDLEKHYKGLGGDEDGDVNASDSHDNIGDFAEAQYGERGFILGTLRLLNETRKKITRPLFRGTTKGVKWAGHKAEDGARFAGGLYNLFRDSKFGKTVWGDRNIDLDEDEDVEETLSDGKLTKEEQDILKERIRNRMKSEPQQKETTTVTKIVDGKVMKFVKGKDGELDPDRSDNATKEAMKDQEEKKETQKGILTALTTLPSTLGGLFTKFFGGNEKEESWFSKLMGKISTPLKIAAAFGVAGWASEKIFPAMKMFWDERLAPYFTDAWNGRKEGFGQFIYFFNPKNPEGLLGKINNFVSNTLPNLIKTAATYVSDGVKWSLENVLPPLVSGLISNLPTLLISLGKGILDGLNNLLFKDNIKDGRTMQDLESMDSKLGSGSIFTNTSSTPSWFDKSVSVNRNTVQVKHLSVSSSTLQQTNKKAETTKKKGILDQIISNRTTTSSQPKAFDTMNQAYRSAALREYEKVKDNIIKTPYGEMTVTEILNSDKEFVTNTETGETIHGYELLNHANTAKQLGMNIRLTDEEMEANTEAHGGGNQTTMGSKIRNALTKSFTRGVFGFDKGIKGASKVVGVGNNLLSSGISKIAKKLPLVGSDELGSKVFNKVSTGLNNITDAAINLPNKLGDAAGKKFGIQDGMKRFGFGLHNNFVQKAKDLDPSFNFIYGLPDNSMNTTTGSTSLFGKLSKIGSKISTKLKEFITIVVEALKGFLRRREVTSKLLDAFTSIKKFTVSTAKQKIDDFTEILIKQIPELFAKYGGKMGAKSGIKLAGYIASGSIVLIADAIVSFLYGMKNANSMLKITEQPGILGQLICGLINALNEVFCLGLVPVDFLLKLVTDALATVGLPFAEELKEKQKAAIAEVEKFNRETGSNFDSVEEYNKRNTIWSKTKAAFKNFFNKDKNENAGITTTTTTVNYVTSKYVNENTSAEGSGLFGKGSGLFGRGSEHDHQIENPANFISQLDPRYKDKRFNISGDSQVQTIGDSGCAPAAAAMAINSTVGGASMEDASKLALKYKAKDDGVRASYFDDEFSRHGLQAQYSSSSSDIKNQLKNNNKVVLMGQDRGNTSKANSPFGPNPHYVTATGMSRDGKYVYINDPEANRPNIKYSANKVLGSSKLGIAAARGSKAISNRFKKYVARGSYGADTVQYKVWNALRAAGYNEISTAAAMGNIQHESGFRVDAIEKGSGAGFGLIQWTGGRRKQIENYAAQKGVSASDLGLQLEFLLKELAQGSGQWTKASSNYNLGELSRNDWASGANLTKATQAFMCCFERPSYDPNINHIDRRLQAASEYYEAFTGTKIDTNLNFSTPMTSGDVSNGNMLNANDNASENNSGTSVFSKIMNAFSGLAEAYGLTGSTTTANTSPTYNGNYDSSTDSTGGLTYNDTVPSASGNVSSNPTYAKLQKQLVEKMYSIKGRLKYSQQNRNVEDESGDCSSTVRWAYQKVLGQQADPGSWTGEQMTHPNTFTVASGPDAVKDESKLQLGDLLLKNGHVEMYAGNNTMIGHGGGANGDKKGPTIKNLNKSGEYNLVRRWIGFKGQNTNVTASGSGLAYDNALHYITGQGTDMPSIPLGITPSNTSTTQYNSNSVTSIMPAYSNNTSSKKPAQTNTMSTDLINIIKSIVGLLTQIVTNTAQLNNIVKLLGDFMSATSQAASSGTQESKDNAILAKQSLINAMQNTVGTNEPNAQLQRLIEAAEKIARA